jgi:hypothetical protein
VACLAIILFYAGAYGVRRLRVPVADDTFFYVWAVRMAGRLGLADSHLAARPAFPLVGSALGTISGASPWLVAVATPITMAAGLALAGGAAAMRWGAARKTPMFVMLVAASAVVARLLAGKTENLLTVWLIAAIIAVGLWADGRRRFWGVAALALGAALSEWPFLVAFIGLLVGALVWQRVFSWSDRDDTLAGMLWPSLVGLAAGLAIVFLWNDSGLGSTIQVLPPDFKYDNRFDTEMGLVWPPVTFPLAAAGWWVSRTIAARTRHMRLLFNLWLLGTAVLLVLGALGLRLPTYRAITFALPLALAVAAAPFAAARLAASRRTRADGASSAKPGPNPRWATVATLVVAVIALIPATALWYRDFRGRATVDQISQFATVAAYAGTLPDGVRPVVVVNRRIDRAAFYERVVADVLPPDQRTRVLVFVGTSEDALAGRPTLGEGPDHDELARQLFPKVAPALRSGAPILTGGALDSPGFAAARAAGAPLLGGGTVAVLRGPPPPPHLQRSIYILPIPDWWQVALIALIGLLATMGCGWGWSAVVLPRSEPWVRAAVAPAFGVSSLAFVALILVHAGVRPSGGGAIAAVALGVAISVAAAAWARRADEGSPG